MIKNIITTFVLWTTTTTAYSPYSYAQALDRIKQLQEKYGNLLHRVTGLTIPNWTPQSTCPIAGIAKECESPVLQFSSPEMDGFSQISHRPSLLVSGAVHGDETLGPAIAIEALAYLLQKFNEGDPYIKWLMARRDIWVVPFANADGFANIKRDDGGVDPNRDFPYMNDNQCFQSNTAKLLDAVIHSKIFVAGLTFHGGMRSLSYPWGGPNHVRKGTTKSTESPDFNAFRGFSTLLQRAAGVYPTKNVSEAQSKWLNARDATQSVPDSVAKQLALDSHDLGLRWWYPIGATNDLVYPVKGGPEDWTYGGGWEPHPDPIGKCAPSQISPPSPEAADVHLMFPLILLETSDDKQVKPEAYGDEKEIDVASPMSGYIPRNIRVVIKALESLRPELLMSVSTLTENVNTPQVQMLGVTDVSNEELDHAIKFSLHSTLDLHISNATSVQIDLFPVGCEVLNSVKVVLDSSIGHKVLFNRDVHVVCGGVSRRDHLMPAGLRLRLNVVGASGSIRVLGVFDSHWAKQSQPDPRHLPVSHLARVRTADDYFVRGWDGSSLRGSQQMSFPRAINSEDEIEVRASLPIYVHHKTPRKRVVIASADVICRGHNQTVCQSRCSGCDELTKNHPNFNVTLFARRSMWTAKRGLRHNLPIPLGTFPATNGVFESSLAVPARALQGRVVAAVTDSTGAMSQSAFGGGEQLARETDAVQALICLFPPGHALRLASPSRLRFERRLIEAAPIGTIDEVALAPLIAALGYIVATPKEDDSGRWSIQGNLCFPNISPDEPIYIESSQNCTDQLRAHHKQGTFLNPFASRTFGVRSPDSAFECVPGATLTASTADKRVSYECTLALLRLGDITESAADRNDRWRALTSFVDRAVCSRSAVAPPLEARTFTLGQKILVLTIAGAFVGMSVLQCLPSRLPEVVVTKSRPAIEMTTNALVTTTTGGSPRVIGRSLSDRILSTMQSPSTPRVSTRSSPRSPADFSPSGTARARRHSNLI